MKEFPFINVSKVVFVFSSDFVKGTSGNLTSLKRAREKHDEIYEMLNVKNENYIL